MPYPPILLNIDAGETADEPEALYGVAHLVHIACGGHAGDDASMDRVLAACKRFSTRVGAHPSYPDRAGFGRRPMTMTGAALRDSVREQVTRLAERASAAGLAIGWVKPHGALYHAASGARTVAEAVVAGSVEALGKGFCMTGPEHGALCDAARAARLAYAREGFADRGARPDGSLVPRGEPGAVVTDPAKARTTAVLLARSGRVDTICIHGDTPGALLIGHAVRAALDGLDAG